MPNKVKFILANFLNDKINKFLIWHRQ